MSIGLKGAAKRISLVTLSTIRCSSQVSQTIQQNIENKRAKAKLGGGQSRIDAQHKKVNHHIITRCLSNFNLA